MSVHSPPLPALARLAGPSVEVARAEPREAPAPVPVPLAGLAVGAADDPAEHAAEVRADGALARLRSWSSASSQPSPDRQSPAGGQLRRVTATVAGAAGGVLSPAASAAIRSRVGSGSPLPSEVQRRMESGFGTSLAQVRVHTDADAARQSAAVSARAFTVGNDIFFGAGQFAPSEPAGDRVLAHEIAHVLADGDAQLRRVHVAMVNYGSKHGEKNQEYLLSTKIPVSNPDYHRAAAAAILLDHDYDSRPTIRGMLEDNQGLLYIETQIGAMFPGLAGNAVVNEIRAYLNKPPKILTTYLRSYIEGATTIAQTQITWGPVDDQGRGTSVEAKFRPGGHGHAAGSDAGGWNPSAAALARRADSHGTFYVRGHLLNRHLGGPGLDYNMVPLTGRAQFGGNNANGAHSDMFEEVIKQKYELMQKPGLQQVGQLEYEVTVDPKPQGGRRGSTDIAIALSNQLLTTLRDWAKAVTSQVLPGPSTDPRPIAQLNDTEVDAHLQALGFIWPASEPIGPEQKRQALGIPRAKDQDHFVKPLKSTAAGQVLLAALTANPSLGDWAKLVTADLGSKVEDVSFEQLQERVLGNRELWELEEELVPGALILHARWLQYGKVVDDGPRTISVRKPDEVDSPYWHSRKSFI